jgi:hypothetical protein
LEDFIPRKEEIDAIQKVKEKVISQIRDYFPEAKGDYSSWENVDIKEVGSTVKGTFVRGSTDIDFYLIGSEPDKIYTCIQKIFPNGKPKKGQLVIWNVFIEEMDIDLICASPKFSKREDTLKHAEFYSTHLNKYMKFEIIKAKAYLKTKGLYGSEMGSIVGVCIEELIRQKKTWLEACKFLAFSSKRPTLQDPTMTKPRDFLASIIPEKWSKLMQCCYQYIQSPHFKYEPMTIQKFVINHEGFNVMLWERKGDKALDFQSLYSSAHHVRNIITHREKEETLEFDVFVEDKEFCLVFKGHPRILSQTKEVCLDSIKIEKIFLESFRKAHSDCYEKEHSLCAIVKREIPFPEDFFYDNVLKRMTKRGYKLLNSARVLVKD